MSHVLPDRPLLLATLTFVTFGKHVLAFLAYGAIRLLKLDARRAVYQVSASRRQILRELRSSWTIFLDGAILVLLIDLDLVSFRYDFSPPTVALHYISIFLFFELWFFGTHVALHGRWLHRFHRIHHRSHATTPLSGLQFSLTEKAILAAGSLGFVATASQFFSVSIYSLLIFYLIYYTNSVLGHSNIEIQPASFTHGPFHKIFTSPTYHAMHHARFHGHYGLTITLFDRLNRSIFPDYVTIHRRVTGGVGVSRLSDRFPVNQTHRGPAWRTSKS